MSEFWDAYKDPRWQRMRLEVMQRDEFMCQECRASNKTLNVHHTYYTKGAKAWEYDASSLRTLCEDCHDSVTELIDEAKRLAGTLSHDALREAIGYLRAKVWWEEYDDRAELQSETIEHTIGACECFGVINSKIQAAICEKVAERRAYRPHLLQRLGEDVRRHLNEFYEENRQWADLDDAGSSVG